MVRVISVHHFSKQHIQTVEQPLASTVAPPDRLLLALSTHCIEVRDLDNGAELMFSFPTVDEVKQIVHCINGNYVATLETKCNRQNHLSFYVRIYANWDSVATLQQSKMTSSGISLGVSECGMVQPMRARIAGRVTPTTSQSELSSLEMIELPVKRRPDLIACCQISGNILVLSTKYLMVYKFHVRTHDISKLRFIDFEELSLIFELSFKPTQISICENYIACMNDSSLHMFTISQAQQEFADTKKHRINDYGYYSKNGDTPLNYKEMLEEEEVFGYKLITVNLPSIIKENSAIHKHCPYTCCDNEMIVNIKSSSPIENWSHSYQINNLLQLKLKPMVIEGAHRQITEEFKCLVLKPLYVPNTQKSKKSDTNKKPVLKSEYGNYLNSVVCMLTTQQEGYLYMFSDNIDPLTHIDNCVTVYPFTAPIYKIVLEDYMLHALTETGLESYTLRLGHQLTRNLQKVNNINLACPSEKESVCLVGLRPFLGVEQLLLADKYLILLANSDSSPTHSCSSSNSNCSSWTLYNLELPSPQILYNDFLSLADLHQFTSPQTYSHLISEAHIVLKITLMLIKWHCKHENAVNLAHPMKNDVEEINDLYINSCRLLGDYYIMCQDELDYTLSLPYYKMSKTSPLDVLKRVQEIQIESQNNSMLGLLFYLKTVLLQIKTWSEADILFTLLGEQNFVDTILDLFNKHDTKSLSILVLKNNLLREYATDKLINIFVQNASIEYNDMIALAVLYLQRYMQKEATDILEAVPVDELYDILKTNWELLFDTSGNSKSKDSGTTFSELTAILIDKKPNMLAELLAYLITDLKAANLEKVLKVFLDFLPSHISKDGTNGSMVLQILLEKYFKSYYSLPENVYKRTNYDNATFEALKILVRTYLSQLQIWKLSKTEKQKYKFKELGLKDDLTEIVNEEVKDEDKIENFENLVTQNEDYLFSKIRWPYLDQMPPFIEDRLSKIMKKNAPKTMKNFSETDLILKKLQALLCSQLVPKQVINEMLGFFKMNKDFKGNASLQSIVLPIKDGIPFLLEKCPQCVLQYGKDRFSKDEEWKQTILLLQQKIAILKNDDNKNIYSFHMYLLKDMLTYLATSLPLQRFLMLLPPKSETGCQEEAENTTEDNENSNSEMFDTNTVESENYEPFILICKQTAHANHIKRLITATGQKLLTTLNL